MKRTALASFHRDLNARMVEFGGWEMPVYYSSITEEHLAVRRKAGIFDVSHMGEILIEGRDAEASVQKITCNDASRLKPGQSQYSALLTEKGTFVDDIIVNRLAADAFLLCVNASNAEKDFAWAASHVPNARDVGGEYSLLAVQGPESVDILAKISLAVPDGLKPFSFFRAAFSDAPLLISRTGYTGEDGFEIYLPWEKAPLLWTALIEAGALPCGLGARDTLRLEAALPLYGHEIDDRTDPFEAGLGWIVKKDKGEFVGRRALERYFAGGLPSRRLVGLVMRENGIARQGYKIYKEEKEIGVVTSGTHSPLLHQSVALGFVDAAFSSIGGKIAVDIHRKKREAEIVSIPFYRRNK